MAVIFKFKTKAGVTHYYGDFVIKGRRYRRFLALSRKTAILALQELEYELRYGNQDNDTQSLTYAQAITKFLAYVELTGSSKAQVKYIASRLNRFNQFCSDQCANELSEVTQEHARTFLAGRSKERITNTYKYGKKQGYKHPAISTVNRDIGFQKRFFKFCLNNGWTTTNPWATVERLRDKEGGKPRYSFTESELSKIFENAGIFYDFYYVLLHTGIRPTDAFVLSSENIAGNSLSLRQRKTGDWMHNIPISQSVMNQISNKVESGGLIFPELQSDRQRRNARRQIQALFEPKFIRENYINLHTFRHTYAHHMLNKGMPKEVLQTFLGHRSIRTTEIYANWVNNAELAKWVT
jgi:site-specific recombinase XerD